MYHASRLYDDRPSQLRRPVGISSYRRCNHYHASNTTTHPGFTTTVHSVPPIDVHYHAPRLYDVHPSQQLLFNNHPHLIMSPLISTTMTRITSERFSIVVWDTHSYTTIEMLIIIMTIWVWEEEIVLRCICIIAIINYGALFYHWLSKGWASQMLVEIVALRDIMAMKYKRPR